MTLGVSLGLSPVATDLPPFTPAQLSPTVWLDASVASTVTTSSGTVSQWADISGNGYLFTQGTAANQPGYGTRTQNGRLVVDFDGTNDLLVSTAPAATWKFLHDGTPYLFAVVACRDVSGVSGAIVTTNVSGTGVGIGIRWLTGQVNHSVGNGASPATVDNSSSAGLGTSTAARVLSILATPAASTAADRSLVQIDRAATARNSVVLGTPSTANPGASLTLGNRQTSAMPLNGFIAELVIVQGAAATEPNRLLLRDYLAGKWGVA